MGLAFLHESVVPLLHSPSTFASSVDVDLELTGLPNAVVVVKVLIFMSGQSMMVAYLDEVFSIHEVVF